MDQDYKSAHKGPDGRKDMAEVSQDGQFRDESDTKVDAQGKDHVDVQTWRGSNDHRFLSDKPGTADDGALTWDEDWARKDQKAEFQGPGVYDLHEESDASSTVRAKVDGDQGWTQFEQDMDYFDALFADDAAWKAKMRDSRVAGPAARLLRRGDDSDSDSDDGHDDDKPHDHLLPESVERWYYPRIDRYASEWREAWVREARGLGAQTCHSGDEQGCGLVIVVPEFHQAAAEYLKLAKKEDPLPQPFRDNVPPALEQIVSWYIQQHRPEMVVVQDVGMAREKMDVTPVEFHGKRDVVVEPRGVEGGPRFKFGWSRGWLPGHHHEKEDDGDNDDDDGKKTKRQILHTEAPLADTAAESEKFAIQPRGAPAPEKCVQDETPWHCACRLGTAPSYPCAVIFGYAGPKIGQNERFKPEDAGALVRRGEAWNPFKEFEEYLKQRHENYWADRKKEEEWKLFVEADKKAHPEEWNDSHKMAFARDVDAVPDSVDLVAAPAGMEDRLQSNTTAGIEHGQSRAAFPVDAMSITVLGLILALFVAVVIQVVKRMRMTPEEKRKEREDYNSRLRDAGIEPRARGDQVEQGPKWG